MKKLSIKIKLIAFVLCSSAILGITCLGSWHSLNQVSRSMKVVTQLSVPKLSHLSDMRYFGSEVTRLFLRVSTAGLSESEVTRLKTKLDDHVKLYEASEKEYLSLPATDEEKELFATQDQKWDEALKLIREGVDLVGNPDQAAVLKLAELNSTTVAKAKVKHNETFQKLHAYQSKVSEEWRDKAEQSANEGFHFLILLSSIGISFNIIGGILFARYLFNALVAIVSRLNREASEVTSAAQSIASTSDQISGGATEQAASLEQTAASMTEITAMVANSASSARISRSVATESHQAALEGEQVMEQLRLSITDIERANESILQQVDQSNHQIGEIVTIIETIRERTKVINDIVFQTKLLSFNASVEAARAGEQGKGFAVVAEEVGKLAQMSGAAAKEITTLLTESVDRVRTTISQNQQSVGGLVKSGSEKIHIAVSVAGRGTEVLQNIVSNVTKMESHITEIANAADEQSKGISEVNTAISQLENVTQLNSAAAEESAASSETLREQALELYQIIGELNQVIQGAGQAAEIQTGEILDFPDQKSDPNAGLKVA